MRHTDKPMQNALQLENGQLREQLTRLLEQARANQQIMQRYQDFDLQFIGADSFSDLIERIFETLSAASELDVVTLTVLDPDHEIRGILQDLRVDLSSFPNLIFVDAAREFGWLSGRLQAPRLGRYHAGDYGACFPAGTLAPASIAIVPLRRNRKLIGVLCLGSLDAARFAADMATDFIEHMASIVAICLENVINTERLKHIGLTDRLTGVNNRRYVEQRLLEEVGRTRRQGYALTCLYIDIDYFKKINDRCGHQGGDLVLREVAMRIKAELRLSDALGRFGGEEFVALLIDAPMADALVVAERIRASVADHPFMLADGTALDVSVSLGVATLIAPEREHSLESIGERLIARADSALYHAKESGRNRVVGAEPDAATVPAPPL
jgi:two-component system cell cycle response regulator